MEYIGPCYSTIYCVCNDFSIVVINLYTCVFYLFYSVCQCLQNDPWKNHLVSFFFFDILLVCIKVYTENYNMKCLNYFAQSCNGPVGVGDRIC